VKVLVVGVGAIGALMTYLFSKDKLITRLGVVIKRPEEAPIIRGKGIKLRFDPPLRDLPPKYKHTKITIDPSVRYTFPDDVFFSLQQALAEINDWDLIVLSLKAFDVPFILRDIAKFFKPKKSFSVVLVQNGWGLEEEVLRFRQSLEAESGARLSAL